MVHRCGTIAEVPEGIDGDTLPESEYVVDCAYDFGDDAPYRAGSVARFTATVDNQSSYNFIEGKAYLLVDGERVMEKDVVSFNVDILNFDYVFQSPGTKTIGFEAEMERPDPLI